MYHRLREYCPLAETHINPIMLKEYNTKVICQEIASAEAFTKAMAQKENPEVSVVINDAAGALAGAKTGLWAKLDPSLVLNRAELHKQASVPGYEEFLVGVAAPSYGIQWRTDIFKEKGWAPPKDWNDLFRPEFKGHVGITSAYSATGLRTLVSFARQRGGDERNIDPGFAMMQELVNAGQVGAFPTSSAMFNQAMERGEIWIGIQYAEAGLDFKASGAPVDFIYAGGEIPLALITAQVMKNAPHPKEAQIFVNLTLGEAFQKAIAEERYSIPVRKNLSLKPEIAQITPTSEEEWAKAYTFDLDLMATNRDAWYQRWMKEIEHK